MHGKMKIRRMRSQDREWGHAGGGTAAAAAAAAARPQKILCMVHGTALYSCTAVYCHATSTCVQLYKTLQLRATARDRRGGLQLSERAM